MRAPDEQIAAPKVGYGRIIRDEEGNVVDIIIDEDLGAEQVVHEEMDEHAEKPAVEAKTNVVRGMPSEPSTLSWLNT